MRAAICRIVGALALSGLVWAGYRATLVNPSFLSDDHTLWFQGRAVGLTLSDAAPSPDSLFHRPFVMALWGAASLLVGDEPWWYRIASLALHVVNALLVVVLASRLPGGAGPPAVMAGLIFATWPLHVEAVVWTSCWFDLVATALYFATLLALAACWRTLSRRWWAFAIVAFQLCLWSKESAFTLPAVALLLALAIRPRPPLRTVIGTLVPLAALLAVELAGRWYVWGSPGGYPGAAPFLENIVEHWREVAWTMVAPLNGLLFEEQTVLMAGTVVLLVLALGVDALRRSALARFAALWIALTLVPVANLLPVGRDLQNARFLYLPAVGFSIVLAVALHGVAGLVAPRRPVPLACGFTALLAGANLVLLDVQVGPWVEASRVTREVMDALAPEVRPLAQPSVLQLVALPDNVKGAYVFRNSLACALYRQLGVRFEIERIPWRRPPFRTAKSRRVYQAAFFASPVDRRLKVTHVNGPYGQG